MFCLPVALQFFFGLLPGLGHLQYSWHHKQDLEQKGREPTAPLEGGVEGWPSTSMWYSMAHLLSTWVPSQGWPEVDEKLICVEKAL